MSNAAENTATETRCRRCRRILKSAESAALGIGPRCAAIEAATDGLSEKQVDKLMQVILDKGVTPTNRKGVYRIAGEDGSAVHIAHVNGNCTCEWGRRRVSAATKPCYAVAAARLAARPVIRTRPQAPAHAPLTVPSDAIWAELAAMGALDEIPAF